jgi:hypothetical protein
VRRSMANSLGRAAVASVWVIVPSPVLIAVVNLPAAPGIKPAVQLVDLRLLGGFDLRGERRDLGCTPVLRSTMALMATACSWCRIISWANMTSASLNWPATLAGGPGAWRRVRWGHWPKR